MIIRSGKMQFLCTNGNIEYGFRPYPDDNCHIIVFRESESKIIKIEPDEKTGYCYRIMKRSIKCGNGLQSFLDFIEQDLKEYKIGDELNCSFSETLARKAFDYVNTAKN